MKTLRRYLAAFLFDVGWALVGMGMRVAREGEEQPVRPEAGR